MNFSPKKSFAQLGSREVPAGLFEKIVTKIEAKRRKRAVWRFGFFGVVFFSAVVLFVPVLNAMHGAMTESGSYHFISLLFSNFSQVASSWQDFALSLMEYLPVSSIASFLAIVFFLLASLRFITRDAKILFYRNFHNF